MAKSRKRKKTKKNTKVRKIATLKEKMLKEVIVPSGRKTFSKIINDGRFHDLKVVLSGDDKRIFVDDKEVGV